MADVLAVRDEHQTQQWSLVCSQWAQQPGVLPEAGNCGKELLLLAAQSAYADRGVGIPLLCD